MEIALRKGLPSRDPLRLRIGAAKKEAGRAFGFVKIQMPSNDRPVTRKASAFQAGRAKLKAAAQRDDAHILIAFLD